MNQITTIKQAKCRRAQRIKWAQFLSADQVTGMFGIPAATLEELTRSSQIPSAERNGKPFYRRSWVQAYLKEGAGPKVLDTRVPPEIMTQGHEMEFLDPEADRAEVPEYTAGQIAKGALPLDGPSGQNYHWLQLLTLKQLATDYNIAVGELDRWMRKGLLEHRHSGVHNQIRKSNRTWFKKALQTPPSAGGLTPCQECSDYAAYRKRTPKRKSRQQKNSSL